MNNYTNAIKTELLQLNDYEIIEEIKSYELNSTILSHLEMSEDLVETIKNQWNTSEIFKCEKKEKLSQVIALVIMCKR